VHFNVSGLALTSKTAYDNCAANCNALNRESEIQPVPDYPINSVSGNLLKGRTA
jgi:hypothetical protein